MKKKPTYLNGKIASILLLLLAVSACSQKDQIIVLNNESSLLRTEEPIVLTRTELEQKWGNINNSLVPVLISEMGDTIPSQIDDLDGDGVWDELFFLYSMSPESQAKISIVWVESASAPVFVQRTNIRMAEITAEGQYNELTRAPRLAPDKATAAGVYQLEGPGWENDLVGFRNYLDIRNGMDIFGKVTTEMVLDRAGINEDYHLMQSWGHDILMVGRSLGSGGIAVVKNDSLIRVAPEANGAFEIITEGPLRSVLRLTFDDWNLDGGNYNLVHEISIHAGSWFYTSKVYFPGHDGDITLVGGITTISLGDKAENVNTFNTGYTVVSTHGAQAYAGENLGMAIMVKNENLAGVDRVGPDAAGINNTVLVKMPVVNSEPVQFRFYSCWEVSDQRFADETGFNQFIEMEARLLNQPITVSVQ
jgi:hypothetical protein